ncbi:MAG TPA: hypothetical protein GXZ91_06490 [Christensenellaceae bacterium]|jgi:hypothetical protein|nr:hypothetical protein [Christensenellaceae bacterium]
MITETKHMIIPEVVSDIIESELGGRISLMPVTEKDNSLESLPGDTLKFPCFRYIGKAEQVDENGQVTAGLLSADTTEAKVKKYAKAVCITDEARLSGFGDPIGEAAKQLAYSIDHAVDEELFSLLDNIPMQRKMAAEALTSDAVADALSLFGEELDGDKLLFTDAKGFAQLRKDPSYIRASDIGQRMICQGVVGEIWGCQIIISSRIRDSENSLEKQHFIVKPGALRLVNKRGTLLEVDREPDFMRSTLYASKHCACYLYDSARVASITVFTGLEDVSDKGLYTVPGSSTGDTRLIIPSDMLSGGGMRWAYLLSNENKLKGTFGTVLTGTTPWGGSGENIAAGTNNYIHAVLLNVENKPLKTATLEINKA